MAYEMTLRTGFLTGLLIAGAPLLPVPPVAAQGPAEARPHVCDALPDLTGLRQALEESAPKMKGLGRLMVTDAASGLEHYAGLAAGLCEELRATETQLEAATTGREMALGFYRICRDDRDTCWKDVEKRIGKPIIVRRGRFFDCVAGLGLGAGLDGDPLFGVAATCGVSLLP